jgi:N-acetylglutamate synthase-like GNAT family acetyltransferase
MSYEIHNMETLLSGFQLDIADQVSQYTKGNMGEKPQMLPVGPSDVLDKFIGYAALENGQLAGYMGAVTPEEHNLVGMSEVGTLWVPEQYRGQGIAHALIDIVTADVVGKDLKAYAFCNPLSQSIFEERGYAITGPESVPATALSACSTCPMKSLKKGCCDTILIYTGENQ